MLIKEYKGKNNYKIRRRGRQKYSAKKYNNPFFADKKAKRKKVRRPVFNIGLKFKLILLSVIVLLLALSGFLCFSRYFNIANILIDGQGRVSQDHIREVVDKQLSEKRFFAFNNRNIFIFNKEALLTILNEKYALESLLVEKKFPNTLKVYYDEKDYAIIWKEGDSYYYVSGSGEIISEANLLEIKKRDYPLVENQAGRALFDKTVVIGDKELNFISGLFEAFKQYGEEFDIDKFIIPNEVNYVNVKIQDGPVIFFDPNSGISDQMAKLLSVKREKLKDDFINKKSINLRIGDAVYIR